MWRGQTCASNDAMGLEDLPSELHLRLFELLPFEDVKSLIISCTTLYKSADRATNQFWYDRVRMQHCECARFQIRLNSDEIFVGTGSA